MWAARVRSWFVCAGEHREPAWRTSRSSNTVLERATRFNATCDFKSSEPVILGRISDHGTEQFRWERRGRIISAAYRPPQSEFLLFRNCNQAKNCDQTFTR